MTTGGHYAFLKISGLYKRCTIVLSRPCVDRTAVCRWSSHAEAKGAFDQGVKELILSHRRRRFTAWICMERRPLKLLHELAQIDGIEMDPYPVLLSGDH